MRVSWCVDRGRSLGGLAAAKARRMHFDAIHLFDEKSESYTRRSLPMDLELVPGWRRMQGIVFVPATTRFEGLSAQDAGARGIGPIPPASWSTANQGRRHAYPDRPAARDARPDGYWNSAALAQTRSPRRGAASRRLGHTHRAGRGMPQGSV